MLRFDQCICGTSSTGTGTLTLAATPTPPGGVDFDVWARATGIGFTNSAAFLVDYEIIEYTDSTFATAKSSEGGTGTLTLGGSSGIANCTLARTTLDYTITSMNSQPATVNVKPGAAFSIGTAANTLVMISPRSGSVLAFDPYFDTTSSDANWGVCPDGMIGVDSQAACGTNWPTSGSTSIYVPIRMSTPMLVKRVSWRIQTYTTVTGTAKVACRLYARRASDGQPGKLLYDFTSSAQITVGATGNFSTGTPGTNNNGNGYFLHEDCWLDLNMSGITVGTINFTAPSIQARGNSPICTTFGMAAGINFAFPQTSAGNGTSGAAPDPATLTGYVFGSGRLMPVLGLSSS